MRNVVFILLAACAPDLSTVAPSNAPIEDVCAGGESNAALEATMRRAGNAGRVALEVEAEHVAVLLGE